MKAFPLKFRAWHSGASTRSVDSRRLLALESSVHFTSVQLRGNPAAAGVNVAKQALHQESVARCHPRPGRPALRGRPARAPRVRPVRLEHLRPPNHRRIGLRRPAQPVPNVLRQLPQPFVTRAVTQRLFKRDPFALQPDVERVGVARGSMDRDLPAVSAGAVAGIAVGRGEEFGIWPKFAPSFVHETQRNQPWPTTSSKAKKASSSVP